MADFKPNANSGTLWPNERKTAQTHPDVRGDLFLDPQLVREQLANPDPATGFVKISISGWAKTIAGKNCLSMGAQKPYVKPAENASYAQPVEQQAAPEVFDVPDDQIPF